MSASRSQLVLSQDLDPDWKAIPLEKFSSAVSPVGAASHHWVHDVRKDDLFLVFRPDRIPCGGDIFETRLMMTISAGVEILERQDVGKLVTVAEEFEHRLQQGLMDRTVESPVHIVVKLPCIALRYPASPTMVRRIQMRFKSEPDYQRAIDFLRELKLPMRSAGSKEPPAAPIRPLRPAPPVMAQNSSGPSLARPYTVSAQNHFNALSSNPLPYLSTESRYFEKPHNTSSEAGNADIVRVSEGMGPRRLPSSLALMPQSTASTLVTAVNWPAYSNQGSQQKEEPYVPVSEIFGPSLSWRRVFDVSTAVPASRYGFGHLNSAKSTCTPGVNPRHEDNMPLDRPPPMISEVLRPMSAPVHTVHNPSSPSLPPRRQLPFPKARAVPKSCTPTNEFSVLPQLKQASNIRQNADDFQTVTPAASTPDQKRISRMPQNQHAVEATQIPYEAPFDSYSGQDPQDERSRGIIPRVEEPSPLAAKSRNYTRPATAPGLRSKAAAANRKRPNDLPDQIVSVSKQIKKTVDRGTQTQTLSGRDHTAPLSLPLTNDRLVSIPLNGARTPSPPPEFMNHIDEFISKYKNRAPPQELWVKPGYSEATPEQRQVILNNFICDNLDSEDFLQLCEDTGDVWRRIGLEM